MKKIIFTLLTATAILCGCAKEMTEIATPAKMVPVSISTSASKTSLDGLNVLWNAGDQITVMGSDNKAYTFTITEGANSATASFVGAMPEGITPKYAMYPKNEAAAIANISNYFTGGAKTDGKAVKVDALGGFNYPTTQAAIANNAEVIPSFGKITEAAGAYSVTMKNTGLLFKIILPSDLTDVVSVALSSTNGCSLTGDFSVDVSEANVNDVWTIATTWDTQAILSNAGAAIAPGTYYLSTLYYKNGNTSDKNIGRNSLATIMLSLKKSDGKIAYVKMNGGPAKSTRGAIYTIDLTDKPLSWGASETVKLNLPADLPSGFPTSKTSRTKVNTTASVNGHDFVFMSDENCKNPNSEGWYGWICTSTGTLTGYFYDGDTAVKSQAFIKLPENFGGKKLREIFFSTTSQNKAVTVVDSLFGSDAWVVSSSYAREVKPTDDSKGVLRIFINQKDCKALTKTRAEGYDYGYYLKLSHSGSFNIIKNLTCVYSDEDN